MPTALQVDDFLNQAESCPVIDTRAPLEFDKGHLPGAINIPCFGIFQGQDQIGGRCWIDRRRKDPAN
jgi:tRNA 2-selenouridine synthase SelU